MSNPTLATKLVALVKGIFGRKAAPAADTAAEDKAVTTTAPVVEETSTETVATTAPAEEKTEKVEKAEKSEPQAAEATEPVSAEPAADESVVTEKAADAKAPTGKAEEKLEEKTEAAKKTEEAGSPTEEAGSPTEEKAEEKAAAGQEPRTEPATPATDELNEDAPAIAEELEVAEAHTKVASDEVLEKVRKDAAPSAEELAVPTYDELTLPSIRARLRKLTIEQVRDLRAYEVAHQSRPEFIRMYDNRIAKLENAE